MKKSIFSLFFMILIYNPHVFSMSGYRFLLAGASLQPALWYVRMAHHEYEKAQKIHETESDLQKKIVADVCCFVPTLLAVYFGGYSVRFFIQGIIK